MLISTRCICGFMPKLHKKSWMVSSKYIIPQKKKNQSSMITLILNPFSSWILIFIHLHLYKIFLKMFLLSWYAPSNRISTHVAKGYSSIKLWPSAVECCAQKLYVFHFWRIISFLPAMWRVEKSQSKKMKTRFL